MKRLLIVLAAAWLTSSVSVKAEGPDDTYIQIYRSIQEADQLAASNQPQHARQRYLEAHKELKRLQTSYPTWNVKLIEFRLRRLEAKLGGPAPLEPAVEAPTAEPSAPGTDRPDVELDDRDHQIKRLHEQIGHLQNDRNVLESKLREALAARPAAIDPQELARSEDRIKALEKERAVLIVSLENAESKAAQQSAAGAAETTQALAEAKQKLVEQSEVLIALRQERDVLQDRLQATRQSQEEAAQALRAENDSLKQQLAKGNAAPDRAPGPAERELASTRAILHTTRETLASLQARLRTLQDERDHLQHTRKDLEAKLASSNPPPASGVDPAELRRMQKERDQLQRKLDDATRQLAENKKKAKPQAARAQADEVSGLRARLEVLEARKIPYTPEELALFKKPQEPAVLTAAVGPVAAPKSAPGKVPSESAGLLLAEAQRALVARRFDEAEKKYLEVLQLDGSNVTALQRLAATQLEQNRPQDAEVHLKRALEQDPKDARTLLLMGIAKFDQDKFDDALDSLSRSAQADPQNAETQNYLGITLSQKGQRGAAETALRKAVQLMPNYSSAHYNLAVVYARQQPPFTELARWHYQKALAYGHSQNPDLERMIERPQAASPK